MITILVDYDNLTPIQKNRGLEDLAQRIITQVNLPENIIRTTCIMRLYGGWYEGSILSPKGQTIAVEAQSLSPALIKTSSVKIKTIIELAYSSLEEPDFHIVDSYRRKGRPTDVRAQKKEDRGCESEDCPLPIVRKALKKGLCPNMSCVNRCETILYRHEQKTLDTLLTCDLIYLAHQEGNIVLVSGDDDFIPPLRSALLKNNSVYRCNPKVSSSEKKIETKNNKLVESAPLTTHHVHRFHHFQSLELLHYLT